MSRTTNQGLYVIDSGDPSAAIGQGMPTADSVDAALSRYVASVMNSEAVKQAVIDAQTAATAAQNAAAQTNAPGYRSINGGTF